MTEKQPDRAWQSEGFIVRLLISYFVIPLIPPVLLLLSNRGFGMPVRDWLGIVLIYGVFGFAAMLLLGTPLLFCYLRLGWAGFLPFMAGGGVCAAITTYAVQRGGHNLGLAGFFAIAGAVSGLFFRMMLFGLRRRARGLVTHGPA
jgi:hypothetical protein